uniref:Predicted nucleic acid-binding protein, contains PIN domain n=1 Tax=Candidatus Kentrum sp. FM TaxID=2126340 RepID=A0A450TD90_9GAMM|nr:MAG: Predicted nucleic acid-binding protein, contains PIN domain [Candidatus Kentron sp. FM]VFJ65181.1 MAG: Predicted nucleic acid-binding protein, contains PIN domain [Candidatus Kentron sp. FM]VFK15279.1 MAG: Predicted nucleic acid-binding protein, contains PIN domain [Candidatus Kentron sp. FM]
MKVLVDTNVILDIALDREPFVEYAALFLKTARQRIIPLFMTATTVTDLYYILRKERGKDIALSFISDLLQFVDVASVDKKVVIEALRSEIPDFEDAIQIFSAKQTAIETVVTRNEGDFAKSGLDVQNPKSFLQRLQVDIQNG